MLFSQRLRPYAQRAILFLKSNIGPVATASHLCIQPHCENVSHIANESQDVNNLHDKCSAHQTNGCILKCKCYNICVPNDNGKFIGCHKHGVKFQCWSKAVEREKRRRLEEQKHLDESKQSFKHVFYFAFSELNLIVDKKNKQITFNYPDYIDPKSITSESLAQYFKSLTQIEINNVQSGEL